MNSYNILKDMFDTSTEQNKETLYDDIEDITRFASADQLVNSFPSRLSLWLYENIGDLSYVNEDQIKSLLDTMSKKLIPYDVIFGHVIDHLPTVLDNIMNFLQIIVQISNHLALEGKFSFEDSSDIIESMLQQEFDVTTIDYELLNKIHDVIITLM